MYKAYEQLVNEVLDEESAEHLKKRIEESGFSAQENADGLRQCKYTGQCNEQCKDRRAYVAGQEIRRYWYECFEI